MPKVKVEALKFHTYNGKEYDKGDTYEVDEVIANSVVAQGMAKRLDAPAAAPAAPASHPVEPMTTTNTGLAQPKKP